MQILISKLHNSLTVQSHSWDVKNTHLKKKENHCGKKREFCLGFKAQNFVGQENRFSQRCINAALCGEKKNPRGQVEENMPLASRKRTLTKWRSIGGCWSLLQRHKGYKERAVSIMRNLCSFSKCQGLCHWRATPLPSAHSGQVHCATLLSFNGYLLWTSLKVLWLEAVISLVSVY